MEGLELDPLTAKSFPGGYTWTLPSRLGQMLQELEWLYGSRNKDYTILGIEFEETGPRVWYPGNCKNIVIQLSPESRHYFRVALYELAHEAVHLLTPTGNARATVLEEGLATLFAWNYVKKIMDVDYRNITKHVGYRRAALLTEKLLKQHPGFIKDARATGCIISEIDEALILRLCPETDRDEARILSMNFNDYSTM